MNSLPNELLFMIGEHLSLKDLLNYRLVCKHLKSICDQIKVKELSIGQSNRTWFESRSIAIGNRIENRLVLNSSLFNLKYLKYLTIKSVGLLNIQHLNELINLEYLEIDFLFDSQLNLKLSLPNLKKFYLYDFFGDLVLETPKLDAICSYQINRIKFVYPESLKLLEILSPGNNFEEFKNVEIFICPIFDEQIAANILEQLPKLKELRFNHRGWDLAFRLIIRRKLRLGKGDVKIYFKDKCLKNEEANLSDINLESESDAESESESDAESESESDAESDMDFDISQVESDMDFDISEVDSEIDSESDLDSESESESDSELDIDLDHLEIDFENLESNSNVDSDSESESDSNSESESDSNSESESDSDSESESDSDSESESDSDSESDSESESDLDFDNSDIDLDNSFN